MIKNYQDYRYQSQDGLSLYARIYNADAPNTILCMHGLTRNSRDFELVADHLADRYRVIVVEQRGRGDSEWDSNYQNYNPQTYVQDMYTLLGSLGVDKVALIGTSLGGLMSMMMRAMTPDRIVGVVLNDIGPVVEPAGIERIKTYVGKSLPFETFEDLAQITKKMHGDYFPNAKDEDWMRMAKRTAIMKDGKVVMNYDPAIARPFNEADDNAIPPDLWPLFAAMKGIELLTIRGDTSDLFSEDTLNKMAEVHGNMARHIVPHEGHAPMMDDADSLAALDAWASRVFD